MASSGPAETVRPGHRRVGANCAQALSADYVVVGAGAAGCALAGRLAEDPSVAVTLIEAGGDDDDWRLRVPLLSMLIMGQDRYNWNLETEPVPALRHRRLQLLAGKLLGGSSSINGLIYTRGAPHEYDRWKALGCEGWGYADLLPYFLKAEGSTRGNSPAHNADGPWTIRHGPSSLPIYDAFLRAAGAEGVPILQDMSLGAGEGVGYYDVNVSPRGRRVSAARAYLHRRRPPNLRVIINATATGITIEDGVALGVNMLTSAGLVHVAARREVILSAGAINSPKLLMLSGVGNQPMLRGLGLQAAHHLPGVGRNLQNHASYTLQYTCSQPVTAFRYLHPLRGAGAVARYIFQGRGPLAETPFAVGGTFRTDPTLPEADMHVTLFSALVTGAERQRRILSRLGLTAPLPERHGFGVTLSQGVPYSRGSVTLTSPDPFAPPVIRPNYFDDARDLTVLKQAIVSVRTMMRQPAIAPLLEAELVPGEGLSEEDLIESIRSNAGTFYHQCGTCAMGDGRDAVVDHRLRVRAVRGLRVADTSIMPLILNATPHSTAIMIGEKAASMIREDWR